MDLKSLLSWFVFGIAFLSPTLHQKNLFPEKYSLMYKSAFFCLLSSIHHKANFNEEDIRDFCISNIIFLFYLCCIATILV